MVAEAVTSPVQASNVTGAIRQAARATGASFEYLLATAQVESRLNPNAKAQTSSARGLYQFIEQTWLETMKRAGATHGYAHYADAISRTSSGRYVVQDAAMRSEILNLRSDPAANALMAGVFTNRNAEILTARLGRPPSEGELYMAHFLGPTGAARIISLAGRSPDARAADLYPHAARANRSIFFDREGHARNAAEVSNTLVARYDSARGAHRQTTVAAAPADAIAAIQPPAAPLPAPVDVFAPPSIAPAAAVTARAASAFAVTATVPKRVAAAHAVFPNLFRDDGRRDPVAPVVTELWGPQRAAAIAATHAKPATEPQAKPATTPEAPPGPPLDLFQQLRPDIRALFGRRA
jgi:hypothetical protein